MALLALLFALTETIGDSIKEKATRTEKRRYDNISFKDIESVTFNGVEPTNRIKSEEEFDILMTDFLTQQDGWQHYETKTVEYEVKDGLNYLFTIRYKDGTKIHRSLCGSSPLVKRLLNYSSKNKAVSEIPYVVEGDTLIIDGVGNTNSFK